MICQLGRLFRAISVVSLPLIGTAAMAAPQLAVSVSPDPIIPGGVSELTFTISTTDAVPTESIAFTGNLPAGIVSVGIGSVQNGCAGSLAASVGASSISFSGGQLEALGTCQIVVPVTSSTVGTHTISTSTLTSDQGSALAVNDTLEVAASNHSITKTLTPTTVHPGSVTRVTYDYTHTTGGLFNYFNLATTLPSGLVLADPANASQDCGGTLNATAGGSTVTLFLPSIAPTSCTVGFDVLAVDRGDYTLETTFTTFDSGSPSRTDLIRAALTVPTLPASSVGLSKSFGVSQAVAGEAVKLSFVLQNTTRSDAATNLTFTDDLDAFLTGAVATSLPSTPCGAGSAITGSSTLSLTGGNLAGGESCEFEVEVTLPASVAGNATYTNVTSNLTGSIGGGSFTSDPAVATLRVLGDGFQPVELSKSFTDDPVAPGGTVTIEYTLTNPNTSDAATSISFTDFPVTLTNITPATGTACGGNHFLVNNGGATEFQFTGGSVAANDSCSFSVTATVPAGTAPGLQAYPTSSISAVVNAATVEGPAASDILQVSGGANLTFTKEFLDDTVATGDPTQIRFTISSAAESPSTATGLAFTDDLDAFFSGTVLVSTPTNTCGGSASGTSTFSYTGGTIAPGDSCEIIANVMIGPSGTGTFTNTTSGLAGTAGGQATTAAAASDDITVFEGGVLQTSMEFGSDTYVLNSGDAETIRYTIDNSGGTISYSGLLWTQSLNPPTGVSATSISDNGSCGASPTLTGTTFLIFLGLDVAAGDTCVIDVTLSITSTTEGSITFATSNITESLHGLTLPPMSDTIEFVSGGPTLAKQHLTDPVQAGDTTTVEYLVTNTLGEAIDTISFTDDLDAFLSGMVATGLPASACGGTLSGTSNLTFSGGSLAANDSCTITATVQVPSGATPDDYSGNTGTLSAERVSDDFVLAGDAASSSLRVNEAVAVTFAKAFSPDIVGPSSSSTLTFTITNQSATSTLSNLRFSDDLSAVVSGLVSTGLSSTPANCGAGVSASGTSLLQVENISIAPSAVCTISFDLQMPSSVTAGTFTNTSSALLQNGLSIADPATDDLTVEPAPLFSQAFSPATIAQGAEARITFTINNAAAGNAASALDFTNTLPGGMTVAPVPNAASSCTGGTLTAGANTSTVSYTGGTVPASSSCTVAVNVRATGTGTLTNTSGDLTSSLGNSGTASASLSVTPAPVPTFTKSFGLSSVSLNGTRTVTLTIDNTGSFMDATGASFSETHPAGLSTATPANASSTCTGGTLTAANGGSSMSYTGFTIPALSGCTITYDVRATTVGAKSTTTSDLITSLGNSGAAAATLNVPSITINTPFTTDNIINGAEVGAVTISGTTGLVGDGRTVSIAISDGASTVHNFTATVSSNTWTTTEDLSGLADGLASISATVTDANGSLAGPATSTFNIDATPPTGHSVSFDAAIYNAANQSAGSFTFAAAEVGAGYAYTISSDGGGANVTGTGTIATATDQITGIDLSGLGDGTLTLSVVLTDSLGNAAPAVTDTATKDVVAPVLAFDSPLAGDDQLSGAEASTVTVSGTAAGAEDGQLVTLSITDSGSGSLSPTANVSGGIWSVVVDMSGLADGTINMTADVSDVAGNAATQATASLAKDATPPTGHSVSFDAAIYNAANQSAGSFTFAAAEVGAGYAYTISSDGGGTNVTGTGTIATATDQITGIDLSGLGDGTLTLSVVLTDSLGNSAPAVTDTATKDVVAPVLAFDSPLAGDDQVSGAEASTVTVSGTAAGAEDGQLVTLSITDSGSGSLSPTANVSGGIWSTVVDMSGLADGTINMTADVSDVAGNAATQATASLAKDATQPTGFAAPFDAAIYNASTQSAASFTFSGAEVGTTYNYTISSDGGGTDVTGTGVIATATDQITGIDLSGLGDGTLTLSATLTDALGNVGAAVTDTATKDVAAPTIAFDSPLVGDDQVSGAEASTVTLSGTTTGAEDGQTVSLTVADSGSTVLTPTATVSGGVWSTVVDMSGLVDGTVTLTADVSDVAANAATQATASLFKDTTAPTGFGATFDTAIFNAANETAGSFTFSGAEIGATFAYTISSDAGGTDVTGTSTIATATDQISGLDLSGLNDGTLTLSVTLTDALGNASAAVTDTATKDAAVPTISFDSPLSADDLVNNAEAGAVTLSGTTTDVENGQTVTLVVTDSATAGLTFNPTVTGNVWSVTVDLSGLGDGTLSLTADVSDVAGNAAPQATANLTMDTTAPSGFGASFDASVINAANASSGSFTFSGAEVGATYAFTISSDGGGTDVTGTGTIATATDQISGLDLSGLGDGELTLSVTLTDSFDNESTPATDTVDKETTVPTVTLVAPTTPQSEPFDVTVTFSEAVTGLATGGFTISGGTATTLTGSNADYVLTVTPDHDGEITIVLDAGAASDASGNPNDESNEVTVTADLTGTPDPAAADADGDGVADSKESATADRDGDSIPDAADYDPTGYFYCEDDGRILSGGGITVSGPSGSNSSVGTTNDITIVQDGSSGFYQWFALRPGTYSVTYNYPATAGIPSTTRLSSGTLDVTSLLPSDPAVLGSTEFGSTGELADASLAANPTFYSSFVIEAGDPDVLANNIPLTQCAENPVIVSATDDGAEANGATTDAIGFTIAQDRISALDTVVSYSMSGTATDGTDYTAASGTLTIPAGDLTAAVDLDVIEDAFVEGTETAILTLTAVTSGDDVTILSTVSADLSGTANITDDDVASIAVTNLDLTASENGNDNASMSFVLLGQPTADVTLSFAGDAQCSVSPATITFTSANFDTAQVLTISARDDDDVEGTHSCQPTVSVASSDTRFDGFALSLAAVSVTDDLVDQIRDPLTEILKDDFEETVRSQQRQFSRMAKGALGRLHEGREDQQCGTIASPDVTGSLTITDQSANSDGKFGWETYNCQTSRREILDGSFSLNWTPDQGTQAILQFSRQTERYLSDDAIRGFFWGGYFSQNSVDGTADGSITGYGLNAGIYGAQATGSGLFVDYYGSAAVGLHSYDLTFDSALGDIDAEGDYSYVALFGGVALSGKRDYDTYSISPRIGLDVAQAWVSDADVTARQLGQTDTGTIDLPNFSGARIYAEVEFSGLTSRKGADSIGAMMTEVSIAPRLACEYSSYSNDQDCSAGINLAVSSTQKDKGLSYEFEIDYERMDELNRFFLSFSRERRFADDRGSVVTRLSMPDTESLTVEHKVKVDF
ncbi:hypothetical protein J7443_01510 [Tropicibacter sp. R15_0]|uniref:DUF7933 domain-containing protein n=1 Tax=Tropicibacter sp. R15_0 TaxID=2821101 RepID=UPI001ADAAC93|nr:Ig-like domain-containing protein [Tropicibacter sp. R15_0]MBO9463895.1 hypothetical protein [Tropicibacter sp. R15_0]